MPRSLASLFLKTVVLFVLFQTSVAGADQIRHLRQPEQALSQFVLTIAQAKKSIDITTFILRPCEISTQIIIESLAARASKGVKVRLLVDALTLGLAERRNLAAYFANYGIQLRLYSAALTPTLNLRLHTKLMVIDGQSYIAGGRNLADAYFGLASDYNFIDEDLFVSGPSAAQAKSAFEELWVAPMTSKVTASAKSFRPWKSFCKVDPTARVKEVREFFRSRAENLVRSAPLRSCSDVRFSADSPHFTNKKYGDDFNEKAATTYMTAQRLKMKRATAAVQDFLGKTRVSLSGLNWVYIPIGQLAKSFAALRGQNIPIEILTNADMESGPKIFREMMEYAIDRSIRRDAVGSQDVQAVSSAGALRDDYDLTPRQSQFFLHSKTLIRDGRDVVVGSFNLDARSHSINLESVITVKGCPSLAKDVQATVNAVRKIHQYDLAQGRIPEKPEPSPLAKILAMLNIGLL